MGRKPKEKDDQIITDDEFLEINKKDIKKEENNNYFMIKDKVEFFSSGCTQLDCILGGGWAERRTFNIIGDKMTSKTGNSVEACINFMLKYPNGRVYYIETEAALDKELASKVGLTFNQKNIILVEDIVTIEGLYNKLLELSGVTEDDEVAKLDKNIKINTIPTLVIVDSMDGLSDAAELERDIEEKSFAMTKAKQSHALFRKLTRKIWLSNITLGIVSQVKDNIGVTFGNKETIACKHALEFFSSQRLWLAHLGMITKTIDGIDMPIGNKIKARCAKNKVGRPFRTCEFPIYYEMGINDLESNINWLGAINKLNNFDFKKYNIEIPKRFSTLMEKCIENEKFNEIRQEISNYAICCWKEIESKFCPPYKKY